MSSLFPVEIHPSPSKGVGTVDVVNGSSNLVVHVVRSHVL